ncbi:hypothetical protein DPMN_080428 [Dreissena polymorpha]|uniref:Uncharacterized protein n=1 Tax=Dreissena polymorpha TaxID=45954 RepID=A0A9D3YRD1_DREPO|nr:hypothetical protein DPMN_080428 [Dreissena polymorpha]
MSQQQRAAALLRQAADLLNVNTCDRSTQYQHLHQKPLSVALMLQRQFLHPTVEEGCMDMQIQELWQCQHLTITPRCNQVGITKEACARYFGTTVYTTLILF